MPLALAAALALLALPGHHADHGAGHGDTHGRAGVWTWRMHTDRFTGQISCRLDARNVSYARQSLTFSLGGGIDTNAALLRIDDGAVRSAHDADMRLAALGVRLENDSLGNPSAGLVHLPDADLGADARRVEIRATPRSRVRAFRIDGLWAALQAAASAGCTPERYS